MHQRGPRYGTLGVPTMVSPPRGGDGGHAGRAAGAGGLAALSTAAGAISIPEMQLHPLNKKQTQNRNAERSPVPGEPRSTACRPAGSQVSGGTPVSTGGDPTCPAGTEDKAKPSTVIARAPSLSPTRPPPSTGAGTKQPRAQTHTAPPKNSLHVWSPLASAHLLRRQTAARSHASLIWPHSGRTRPLQFIVSAAVTRCQLQI